MRLTAKLSAHTRQPSKQLHQSNAFTFLWYVSAMLWHSQDYFIDLTNVVLPDGEHGKKSNGYQKMTRSDADVAYMLSMRQNQVHYISLIDVFAPCIVSNSVVSLSQLRCQLGC